MRRGDIIVVRERNTPAAKARPYVVVQRDSALEAATKVTACPLTSQLRGPAGQRPLIVPTPENGLRVPREVQTDWVYTHPLELIGGVIGKIDRPTLARIDTSLRRWLDL